MYGKNKYAIVLLGFAVIFLFTSAIFHGCNADKVIRKTLPTTGGLVGPIEVKKDRSVYLIEVGQNIHRDFDWSAVSGELLDAKKEYLFGFGKEFWKESGYDEGPWTEKVTSYKMKITIPKRGTYYFNFEVEKAVGVKTNVIVNISRKYASSLPFFWFGILFLIVGVAIGLITNKQLFEE